MSSENSTLLLIKITQKKTFPSLTSSILRIAVIIMFGIFIFFKKTLRFEALHTTEQASVLSLESMKNRDLWAQ